ncbi:Embryonic protein UVS.2 [Orchesella cincta]|uniref:Metalloendopeptidase n=1 Tax=Orchesella cincta TaxID=48709 RepID=A0A1D2MM72_ORCCI|nr:Embryonic protein UVS.2 [Orchesella cincta]
MEGRKYIGCVCATILVALSVCKAQSQTRYCSVIDGASENQNYYRNDPRWPNVWPADDSGYYFVSVAYELDSSLNGNDIIEVQKAFADIQKKTCVRFRPRSTEPNFVRIQNDETVCGVADVCFKGGMQTLKVGGSCRNMSTIIHQLGHTLCLPHEHARPDRDEYVSYDACPPTMVPEKDSFNTRGQLYDYGSRMQLPCGCHGGGFPKSQTQNLQCGVSTGLSVLDADKLNDFYDCLGCNRHRWQPIESFVSIDEYDLVSYGSTASGSPLYMCRGYIGGAYVTGKYWPASGICYLPYSGGEHQFTTKVQILTLPAIGASYPIGGKYKTIPIRSTDLTNVLATAVKVGKKINEVPCFGAIAMIGDGASQEKTIGVVCADAMDKAYFPFHGAEIVRSEYDILTCEDNILPRMEAP